MAVRAVGFGRSWLLSFFRRRKPVDKCPKCGSRAVRSAILRQPAGSRPNGVDLGACVGKDRLEEVVPLGEFCQRARRVALLLCRSDEDVVDAELARELRRGLGIPLRVYPVGLPRAIRGSQEYPSMKWAGPPPCGAPQMSAAGSTFRARGRSDPSARSHRAAFPSVSTDRRPARRASM